MITLRDFMRLTPYAGFTFASDEWVQVCDHHTGAHFRMSDNEVTLGGDFYANGIDALMDKEVTYIEFYEDCTEVYVRG